MIRCANRAFVLPLLLLFFIPTICHSWSGKVVYVVDGDTIDVDKGGERVKVRLYGIDTPEKSQWYGQNAKTFTSAQVMGKMVDVQEIDVDRYGRVVGIVSVGNLALNRHLVEYWVRMGLPPVL